MSGFGGDESGARGEATQRRVPLFLLLSSTETILVLLVVGAGLLLAAVAAALSWLKRRAARERLNLVGRLASVERDLSPEGFVLLDGELWPARTTRAGVFVGRGSRNVRVVAARGHLLEVEPSGDTEVSR